MNTIFLTVTRYRNQIVKAFQVSYVLILAILIIGTPTIVSFGEQYALYYALGRQAGQAALVVFILTTIPGIARRFRIKHKLIAILMIFRRYIGILMYALAFAHYWTMTGAATFIRGDIPQTIPAFLFFGLGALTFTTPMFFTSNDLSVGKLGAWWHRIHKLTYIIVWLIFFHVALQRVSIWTLLIGAAAVAQVSSHAYSRFVKRSSQGTSSPPLSDSGM